jgi:hypothetical protein
MSTGAINTLFQPLELGQITLPAHARMLFIGAQHCAELEQFEQYELTLLQHFKPDVDALERAGYKVTTAPPEAQH